MKKEIKNLSNADKAYQENLSKVREQFFNIGKDIESKLEEMLSIKKEHQKIFIDRSIDCADPSDIIKDIPYVDKIIQQLQACVHTFSSFEEAVINHDPETII